MSVNKYRKLVLDVLQGKTPELQIIPPERLDWDGPGGLLEVYHRTSGEDRKTIVQAIGGILRESTAPAPVLAQLVDIASALDLAEVEPSIRSLQSEPVASQEPLRQSITNYFAYRKLITNGQAEPTPGGSRKRRGSGSRKQQGFKTRPG